MGYPVTVDEEELDLFRIARLLGKPKVVELLKTLHSKGITVDDLLSYVRGGTGAPPPDKEALSFIFSVIAQRFPDIEIPEKFRSYMPERLPDREIPPKRDIVAGERRRERAARGELTPQAEYDLPILEALVEMGGSGSTQQVLEKVYAKLRNRLTRKDLEMTRGTVVRWKNRAAWERFHLIRRGYLKRGSPRGIWEITDEGRKFYESQRRK
ncbi:MAG: winged helix-turn-helix domain-containing protein [Candidatus Bathyarchaeia archaeon]